MKGREENKIYGLLEEKMTMYTSNISTEGACVEKKRHRVGEKSNEKERATPFFAL